MLTLFLRYRGENDTALSDEQLQNVVLTFLTMGHENVGTALAWTLIFLSKDQQAQENVRKEIRDVVGSHGNMPWESMDELPTLSAAFDEAIRLFPSVPAVTRAAAKKEGCSLMGYHIPSDVEIVCNLYAHNRLANGAGSETELFRPQCSHQAVRFGGGERVCLGRPLAYLEARVLISKMLACVVLHAGDDKPAIGKVVVSLRPWKPKVQIAKL